MSEFSKTFLRERIDDEERPWEHFGIFGKHPGWNDHIEDLPLPTHSMAVAKQLLYVQGIGSQISSGAWSRLAADARLADFGHAFLWIRGRAFLAGVMWASADGKKRAHFPMIAVVQGGNVARDTILGSIFGQLERIAERCRAVRSAEEVRTIISSMDNSVPFPPDASAGPKITFPAVRESVLQIARDFREKPSPCTRLPSDMYDLPRSLRFWARVCTALAPADVPLLFVSPLGGDWVDLLVGEPAPEKFFCLRAAPQALPIAYSAMPNGNVEEVDADEIAKTAAAGKPPAGERSWISRLLRH